jgi:hypothetical protein
MSANCAFTVRKVVEESMKVLPELALFIGLAGAALLLVFQRTGRRELALWGQILIAAAFGIISFVAFRFGALWIGGAAAFAALWPMRLVVMNRIKLDK